jgi:hypothetical protein
MPNRSRFALGELSPESCNGGPGALVPKAERRGFLSCCAGLSFTHGTVGSAKYSGREIWDTPARDRHSICDHCGAVRGRGDRAALAGDEGIKVKTKPARMDEALF